MHDILENTPTRLVMRLGSGRLDSTLYTFDKTTRRARFQRKYLFIQRRPIEAAFEDIVGIDPVDFTVSGATTHYVLLRLRSGKRHWLSGDTDPIATIEAAKQMREFAGVAEPAADAPVPVSRSFRWSMRVASVLSIVAAVVVVIANISNIFLLPQCDSSKSRDVLGDIFRKADVKVTAITDFSTTSETSKEKRCLARIGVDNDKLTIGYRLFWDGWTPTWQVLGAAGVAKIDQGKLDGEEKAVEAFLERAKDSHTSGQPPREGDPAVKAMLDTAFDFPYSAEALAYSEMPKAIQWFNNIDRIGVVYILAGTGVDDMEKLPDDAEAHAKTYRNVAEFAPEFGRFLDAQLLIMDTMVRAETSRAAFAQPAELDQVEFKTSAADVRATLVQTITKTLTSLAYDGITDDWRRARLAMLKATAANSLKLMQPEDRKVVHDHALKVVEYIQDPAVKSELTAFANSYGAP